MQDNKVSVLKKGTFQNFTCLKYLYLERNNLSVEVGGFSGCDMVQKVHLNGNHIPTLTQDILNGLSNLLYVFIDDAAVDTIEPRAFQNITKLNFLSLKYNELTTPPCDAFAPDNTLKTLYLTSNKISHLPDNCFADFRQLTKLYLKGNPLIEPNPVAFQGLDGLELLDLQYTNLSRVPTGIFSFANKIKKLYLSFNNIRHLDSRDFMSLSRLTHLYIQHNQLVSIHGLSFELLVSLQTLDVSYNAIRSVGQGAFDGFNQIEEVRLQHNNLNSTKNISFSVFAEASIQLSHNPLHCDCSIYPLQDWLKRASLRVPELDQHPSHHARCASPSSVVRQLVKDVPYGDICPSSDYPNVSEDTEDDLLTVPNRVKSHIADGEEEILTSSSAVSQVQLIVIITGVIVGSILIISGFILLAMKRRMRHPTNTVKKPGDIHITDNPLAPIPPPRPVTFAPEQLSFGGQHRFARGDTKETPGESETYDTNLFGRKTEFSLDHETSNDTYYVSLSVDGQPDSPHHPRRPPISLQSSQASLSLHEEHGLTARVWIFKKMSSYVVRMAYCR